MSRTCSLSKLLGMDTLRRSRELRSNFRIHHVLFEARQTIFAVDLLRLGLEHRRKQEMADDPTGLYNGIARANSFFWMLLIPPCPHLLPTWLSVMQSPFLSPGIAFCSLLRSSLMV